MAALKKGFEQTVSSGITGIRSMFGDPVAAAQAGLEQQQQNIANRYADQVGWDRVVQKYQDPNGGLFPAIGEVARQVPLALAEQAPNIGLSVAGAKLGAMGGTALAPMLGPFAAAGRLWAELSGLHAELRAAAGRQRRAPAAGDTRAGELRHRGHGCVASSRAGHCRHGGAARQDHRGQDSRPHRGGLLRQRSRWCCREAGRESLMARLLKARLSALWPKSRPKSLSR